MFEALINTIAQPLGERRSWLARVTSEAAVIRKLPDAAVDQLLDQLGQMIPDSSDDETSGDPLTLPEFGQALQPVFGELVQRETDQTNELADNDGQPSAWNGQRTGLVAQLYSRLPAAQEVRSHLLCWLASSGQAVALEAWGDLICDDPPEYRPGIVLAFSPLLRPGFVAGPELLSKLLHQATAHPQIAPAVFDLFNYYFRAGKLDVHPAEQRCEALTELLGQLAQQMGKIEEGNFPAGMQPDQINQLVSDSVSMIVALCDLFALLGHEPAIGKLHQTLGLKHRRVQTEAASALARLDDDLGRQALIGLAEEPVARLRVLTYAEELGLTKDISLEFQGEIAIAESHLAIWLSEPKQMGLAPSAIQLVDNREYYWPSYEHPVQCYLFRYSYGTGDSAYRNIGICGPVTHAFPADIQHLDVDDMYAAFAGWQTVHNEIFQMTQHQAETSFANDFRRLVGSLNASDIDGAEIVAAGSFFGELVLLASGQMDGQPGSAIVDSKSVSWFGEGNPKAAIDGQLAYAIWRGRQLLANFNPSEST